LPEYRIVDISKDLRPFTYDRGFVQHAISGSWLDADLRIVMPKLRTAPTDFAHLSMNTLEGSNGRIDDDGLCRTQRRLPVGDHDAARRGAARLLRRRRLGAGGRRHLWRHGLQPPGRRAGRLRRADALSVDEVMLGDLGVGDPRRAPIVRLAYHWFGLAPATVEVDGTRPDLGDQLRGAHASRTIRALGLLSDPIYTYLSSAGRVFVPGLDTVSFPPLRPIGPALRTFQRATQRVFGIRAPAAAGARP
jgi:hypothetical protein